MDEGIEILQTAERHADPEAATKDVSVKDWRSMARRSQWGKNKRKSVARIDLRWSGSLHSGILLEGYKRQPVS